MNRTREMIPPTECLKMIIATLNNPSIKHERIEMVDVYNATVGAMQGRAHKPLTLTSRGVVIEGLVDVLAAVHAWKAVPFDVMRGVHGERVYSRIGTKKSGVQIDAKAIVDQIEHRLDLPRSRRSGRA